MFRVNEVIAIATRIEENGAALYQAMAAAAKDKAVQELLERLSAAEKQHIEDFQQIARQFDQYAAPESYPGEYENYARALAEENVFSKELDPSQLVAAANSDLDILDLALRFEKESVLFLTTFRNLVFSTHEGRGVDALIQQEQEHIVHLAGLKKQLGYSV